MKPRGGCPCAASPAPWSTDGTPLSRMCDTAPLAAVLQAAGMLSTGLRAEPVRARALALLGTTSLLNLAVALWVRRFVRARSATVVHAGFPHPRPPPRDLGAAWREIGFAVRQDMDDTLRDWWRVAERARQ